MGQIGNIPGDIECKPDGIEKAVDAGCPGLLRRIRRYKMAPAALKAGCHAKELCLFCGSSFAVVNGMLTKVSYRTPDLHNNNSLHPVGFGLSNASPKR